MQTIYIDISNKSVLPTIYAKQGDVGRKFKAVISNSGVAYQITSESFTASYDGASGSGNYDQIEGRSAFEVSGNTVVVELAPNIFQAPGDSLFCLTMKNGDNSVIGLWNIPIYTEEKPGFLGDPIGDYYPGISAVLYVDQSLDSKQKEKARKNVGAVGYERQQLSETEKDQARENIGAADFKFVGDSAAALDAVIEMQEALLNASGTKPDDYGTPYAVEYIKQELTESAKAQARENIGAITKEYADGCFSPTGNYLSIPNGISDLQNFFPNGPYRLASDPQITANGHRIDVMIHFNVNANSCIQFGFDYTGTKMQHRGCWYGTWYDWVYTPATEG